MSWSNVISISSIENCTTEADELFVNELASRERYIYVVIGKSFSSSIATEERMISLVPTRNRIMRFDQGFLHGK